MILITEFMDDAAVAALRARHDTVYDPGLADRQAEIPGRMAGVRSLIVRNRTQVTEALLAAAPDLACVGRLGVGLDNIDMAACESRGVTVYPATGANNLSVAEYVITAAMTLLRRAWFSNAAMLAGEWPRQACAGRELAGKTLGLIGFGAIARDTARLARSLGMEIVAFDPFVQAGDPGLGGTRLLSLDEVLARSDVVSLHVPLTNETRHLIGESALRRMRKDAIVVNAARGGVVDEAALAAALEDGRIGGAALDVFETEPLTAEAAERFAGLSNLVLTPHIAGVTEESNTRVSALIAERVLVHLGTAA
ncbi:MAG: hydroxyacid dehydrogenase [Zhengella sp.]|uniref:hydroxyacid dehydrogenase n=1 Tax=Zhengella sp. TaxID=2282762 RepID=UPI001E0306E5|nr:hydroxyacid dehydrogenase [Notoacmeibacter sp.]